MLGMEMGISFKKFNNSGNRSLISKVISIIFLLMFSTFSNAQYVFMVIKTIGLKSFNDLVKGEQYKSEIYMTNKFTEIEISVI
jgi:flagellar biosynthesis protein FliR